MLCFYTNNLHSHSLTPITTTSLHYIKIKTNPKHPLQATPTKQFFKPKKELRSPVTGPPPPPTMAHHCRRLSDPHSFENHMFESCLSSSPPSPSSNISFASKPPPPSPSYFNVFKAGCFPLKLKAFSLMANGNQCDVDPVHAQPDARKKSIIGHQRRQELEEEVAELRIMLENEEKVHEILERALSSNDGRSKLHIPSFLPKKMKELLAELVIVEEEISRLESKINKIQRFSSQLQEVQANVSSEVVHYQKTSRILTSLDELLRKSKMMEEKIALETKPVYFINQAIKGDYSIRGFNSLRKKENISCTINKKVAAKRLGLQESAPRKSVEKQSSPKPPRHSSPPRISDANIEILLEVLKEPSISVNQMKKDGLNFPPNKLSEKIMKCLLCIFSRLIRASRVLELEKLGNLSRSSNSFLRSRSFRVENGLNLNTSLNIQKETGQQDPYGIFEIEDSLVRDIGPYKNLVRCTYNSLDLKSIPSCLQLLSKLRVLLNSLREVDLRFLNHHQKLAFWINVYNICIMHAFLQNGLPSSPEKIIGLKNKAVLNIGGNKLNSLAIEHFILRQASNKEVLGKSDKDEKEDAVRCAYGLEKSEPNVTFALCCGSRSSPCVRIYTVDGVSAELEKSKLEYIQASIVVTASKKLMIPKLLVSNMHDFAKDLSSLVEWICSQLPSSGPLRKSMAECLKSQSHGREISDIVDIIPYNFEFQYLLPM